MASDPIRDAEDAANKAVRDQTFTEAARVMWSMFDALTHEGFTRPEALEIVINRLGPQ